MTIWEWWKIGAKLGTVIGCVGFIFAACVVWWSFK